MLSAPPLAVGFAMRVNSPTQTIFKPFAINVKPVIGEVGSLAMAKLGTGLPAKTVASIIDCIN